MSISVHFESEADVGELLGRCLGRKDIAQRILLKFQECLWNDLKLLERAVETGAVRDIAHVAHRLKGSALVVSARTLSRYAAELEIVALEGDSCELPPCFARLQSEASRLRGVHAAMHDDLAAVN